MINKRVWTQLKERLYDALNRKHTETCYAGRVLIQSVSASVKKPSI